MIDEKHCRKFEFEIEAQCFLSFAKVWWSEISHFRQFKSNFNVNLQRFLIGCYCKNLFHGMVVFNFDWLFFSGHSLVSMNDWNTRFFHFAMV